MFEREAETVTISLRIPKDVYDFAKKLIAMADLSEEEFWREELLSSLQGTLDAIGDGPYIDAWIERSQEILKAHGYR